jgi:hypothetical protein
MAALIDRTAGASRDEALLDPGDTVIFRGYPELDG